MSEFPLTPQEVSTPERNLQLRLLALEGIRRGLVKDGKEADEAIENLLNMAAEYNVEQKTPEGEARLPVDIYADVERAIRDLIDQQH